MKIFALWSDNVYLQDVKVNISNIGIRCEGWAADKGEIVLEVIKV